ncbi:MAG: flavodoxin family protein [Candidatus Omnitrophica bacterium]|nr:flavodoxin family protein [Candidatus Omnitrophota bacterium]
MKKIAIIYYSFSGNTKSVAEILKEIFETREYEVTMISLEPVDEATSFLKQALRAFFKKKAAIREDIVYNLSGFDMIALGTPVWAFAMAPAMRTYLSSCRDIVGKNILLFATYGSGAGKDKCVNEMADIVGSMGALKIMPILVQQNEVKNYRLVMDKVKRALLNG